MSDCQSVLFLLDKFQSGTLNHFCSSVLNLFKSRDIQCLSSSVGTMPLPVQNTRDAGWYRSCKAHWSLLCQSLWNAFWPCQDLTGLFLLLGTLLMGLQITCDDDSDIFASTVCSNSVIFPLPLWCTSLVCHVQCASLYTSLDWTSRAIYLTTHQLYSNPAGVILHCLHSLLLSISWCHLQTSWILFFIQSGRSWTNIKRPGPVPWISSTHWFLFLLHLLGNFLKKFTVSVVLFVWNSVRYTAYHCRVHRWIHNPNN